MANVTPMPTYNFGRHAGELLNATINQSNQSTIPGILLTPYTDMMGEPLTYGIIFFGIIGALFLRQEEGSLVLIVSILIGGAVLYLVPPEFRIVANALFILILGGLLYLGIKKKGA